MREGNGLASTVRELSPQIRAAAAALEEARDKAKRDVARVSAAGAEHAGKARTVLAELLKGFSPRWVDGQVAFYRPILTAVPVESFERWRRAAGGDAGVASEGVWCMSRTGCDGGCCARAADDVAPAEYAGG
ncbi:hypothetical protein GCM10023336_55910 [Streptomyces similanensis]|uniref:Uncharacterized protein n=1 Tax=Streptomyces similanensis TaxID=1274988 RepID=A0ABP9L6X8_9ACTN